MALAFCRADMLIELDDAFVIVFSAGATAVLGGATPDSLIGRPFLDHVAEAHRASVRTLLAAGGDDDRIDDVMIELAGPVGRSVPATLAGYRVPDFDNHYFLALKVESVAAHRPEAAESPPNTDGGLMMGESFGQAAAEQVHAFNKAGRRGQISLVRVQNVDKLAGTLDGEGKRNLMTTIGDVLQRHSLGGDTAGHLEGENFGFAHSDDVDPEQVNDEIEEATRDFDADGEGLRARSVTLDADDTGMTEEQVTKALAHTIGRFCAGKGRLTVANLAESLDEMMTDTVETADYIKAVSKNREFDIVYMPICDLQSGQVQHFEALSRFRDTERAKSTFQVITLAEELGLIVDFDFAVFDKVSSQITKLVTGAPMPSVAMNLSAISLATPAFTNRLHKRLKKEPGLRDLMMFELTESAEAEDLADLNNVIQGFREVGFKFCLDDFGAGAASFDYLNMLDVDVVKFDGPVVRRACLSKKGNEMLSAMAKMCEASKVKTVAEMVEDKKVANQVFYCGVDYGQGWHFGKPNPDPYAFADRFAAAE